MTATVRPGKRRQLFTIVPCTVTDDQLAANGSSFSYYVAAYDKKGNSNVSRIVKYLKAPSGILAQSFPDPADGELRQLVLLPGSSSWQQQGYFFYTGTPVYQTEPNTSAPSLGFNAYQDLVYTSYQWTGDFWNDSKCHIAFRQYDPAIADKENGPYYYTNNGFLPRGNSAIKKIMPVRDQDGKTILVYLNQYTDQRYLTADVAAYAAAVDNDTQFNNIFTNYTNFFYANQAVNNISNAELSLTHDTALLAMSEDCSNYYSLAQNGGSMAEFGIYELAFTGSGTSATLSASETLLCDVYQLRDLPAVKQVNNDTLMDIA
ncbi:MAG TPA: hypothetical protein VKS21_10895, partial [Spirochaetota bacterium]|nr:hypothetical protein [Spirochaetota bacterium]